MLEFLNGNWLWILLIGGMLVMHLGHGRGHGGHMGCGAHLHSGEGHQPSDEHVASDAVTDPHAHPRPDRLR